MTRETPRAVVCTTAPAGSIDPAGDAEPDDAQLMIATAEGDHTAFARLVERHQQRVWRLAYRSLGDAGEAEDVAQEAFLRLFDAAPRYRPSAKFTTYLYSIVSRLCIDRFRKHRPRLSERLHETPTDASPAAPLTQAERDAQVQRAILRLPAPQRIAVVLRYEQELTNGEIARVMKRTAKSVERLLARARVALETEFAELADME